MTLDQFIAKYLGKTKGYPDDTRYLGQCLSIVKLYIKECFGINPPPSGTNSAYGYWSNFPNPLGTVFVKVEKTADLVPEYGWIVIWRPWDGNSFGHIAIVDKGCTKTILKNLAQNWTSKVFQRESQDYKNVIGFLRPIKSLKDDMTDEQKRILQFLTEQNATEGDVRQGIAYVRDKTVERLETDVKSLKTQVSDLIKRVSDQDLQIKDLNLKLEAEMKSAGDYQSQLKTANNKIDKLTKQIETKEQEIIGIREASNKYQRLYKEALEKSCDKLDTRNLLKLLISKLWKK